MGMRDLGRAEVLVAEVGVEIFDDPCSEGARQRVLASGFITGCGCEQGAEQFDGRTLHGRPVGLRQVDRFGGQPREIGGDNVGEGVAGTYPGRELGMLWGSPISAASSMNECLATPLKVAR